MDKFKSHIDLEIVSKEFRELAQAWRATWVLPCAPLNRAIHDSMRPRLSPEALEEAKPQEEAHEKMAEYIVTLMLLARETGANIPHIFQILSESSGFASTYKYSWTELLQDVIARMALQPKKVDQLEGAEAIEGITKLQREKIGNVTFGITTD